MQQAATATSLDAEGLAPWHLKIDVQFYDNKGQPTDKGAIEEWWQSPKVYRVNFTWPGHTATELHAAKGAFHSADRELVPITLDTLLAQVVHPMPPGQDLAEGAPEFRKKSFGKVSLECIMVDHLARLNGDAHVRMPAQLPLGLFPTYCFDPGGTSLRVTFDLAAEAVVRNGAGTFQTRNVATSVTINEGAFRSATGQITTLRSGEPIPADTFVPGSEMTAPQNATPVAGGVIAGNILSKQVPVYPQSAKDNHISGDVVLHAIIGRDGKIRSLRVLSTPDGDLALSSLLSVRNWTYKPYLLNGQPVEVDTTITVHFSFGGV